MEVGIVIGGGNFWRGRSSKNIDRTKADQIGMLATVMNCIYVSEIFRSQGMMTSVLTPFSCGEFTKMYSKDRCNKYFAHKMVFSSPEVRDILIFPRTPAPYCGLWRLRRTIFCWPRQWTGSMTAIQRTIPGQKIFGGFDPGGHRQKAEGGGPDRFYYVHGAEDAHDGVRAERKGQYRQRGSRRDHRHQGDCRLKGVSEGGFYIDG